MKGNLLFLIGSLMFLSCNNCIKLYLSTEDKRWVKNYQDGQKILFSNGKGKQDTLTVLEVNNFHSICNSLELSKYQSEIYEVIFSLKTSFSESGTFRVSLGMDKHNEGDVVPSIVLDNMGTLMNISNWKDSEFMYLDTVVNKQKFDSLLIFTLGVNADQYREENNFKSFLWSKEIGLVGYTRFDNSFFYREFNEKVH